MLYVLLIPSWLVTIALTIFGVVNSAWAFATVFVLSFLAAFLLWFTVGIIGVMFVNTDKEYAKKDSKFFRFYENCIIDIIKFFLRIRVKVEGGEKIPKERFLLISNHRSSFDPILQIGALREYKMGFVSKIENLKMPVIGRLMYRCACVFLDRENFRRAIKTLGEASDIIKSGEASMGIYPEGTRNRGEGLLPFKSGAFHIAKKAGCPIVVTLIQNSEKIKGNAPFKRTDVVITVLGVISAEKASECDSKQLEAITFEMMKNALDERTANK